MQWNFVCYSSSTSGEGSKDAQEGVNCGEERKILDGKESMRHMAIGRVGETL